MTRNTAAKAWDIRDVWRHHLQPSAKRGVSTENACYTHAVQTFSKLPLILSICVITVAPVAGQDVAITIALTATSGTSATYLLENFPKSGCPNISIILDGSKADYVLDAHGGDFEGAKGSEGAHGPRPPQPKARYTLYHNGTVVFGTTPVKEKNAVKDVCKFLLKGSTKP